MDIRPTPSYQFKICEINYIINNIINKEEKQITYLKNVLRKLNNEYEPSLLWNRTYGNINKMFETRNTEPQKKLFCENVNKLIKLFFNISDSDAITNERIIIGHCVQSEFSLLTNTDGSAPINTTLKTLEGKTEIIEIYNNTDVYTGIAQLNETENNIFGITCECEKPDQAKKDFSIYKVDIGSSRAFDKIFPLKNEMIKFEHYLLSRTPQVLKIFNEDRTTNNKIQIIRSTVKNTLNNMARPDYDAHKAKYLDDEATRLVPVEVAKSGESAYDRKLRLGEA